MKGPISLDPIAERVEISLIESFNDQISYSASQSGAENNLSVVQRAGASDEGFTKA
jgi:hypothetical protein